MLGTSAPYAEADDVGTCWREGGAPGTPGVVSVTRALGATGFASAVTGAFDVRIILTEEPAAFDASHILVENGTNSAPVAGLPIDGGVDATSGARASTIVAI